MSAAIADSGRISVDYMLTQEVNTAGYGIRSTSADYTLDDAGDPVGSESSSADYRLRDGFTGQLIDAIELRITGPDIVTETATIHLEADLIYDDDSIEPDVPADWSVASGSIDSIDANGLLTPQVVFQNSTAFARADYLALTDTHELIITNTLDDNFGSYASDGIDDLWQWQFFGLNNPAAFANQDPDGDGHDNLREYLFGYLPNDSLSLVRILLLSENRIQLSKVIENRTYQLYRSEDLTNWFEAGTTLTVGSEQLDQTMTDPTPPIADKLFYRVGVNR